MNEKQGTTRPRLVRTTQAAEYLAMSPAKLRRLAALGRIPVVQTEEGAPFLFDIQDLDQFVERAKETR